MSEGVRKTPLLLSQLGSAASSRRIRYLGLRTQAAVTTPTIPSTPKPGCRRISSSQRHGIESRSLGKASKPNPEESYDDRIAAQTEKQMRTPWHREGSNLPPVRRARSASAMTKGKLLTTPSRLLKLIVPLTTVDKNSDRKDVQPLALLVHPQQPLSYLERLIQAELPTIAAKDGQEKIPAIHFKAEDLVQDEIKPQKLAKKEGEADEQEPETEEVQEEENGSDEIRVDGKLIKTGKITPKSEESGEQTLGGEPVKAEKTSSSRAKQDAPDSTDAATSKDGHHHRLVRWSSSTEIGDFIRDAARGKEFAVEIEGSERDIMIGVPSFSDRTHYLRSRLRKISRRIAEMAEVKEKCDKAAHRSAQHVALGGFGGLLGWWVGVWYLTFHTSLGWDVMEPVTYLVGLSSLMGGYLWFLYHNREVSYRSALNLTVSRRQHQLYHARGFDLNRWESLVQDGNALRYEIKKVADEYDVEWDETQDEYDEKVTKALRRERETSKKRDEIREEEEEEEEAKQEEVKKGEDKAESSAEKK